MASSTMDTQYDGKHHLFDMQINLGNILTFIGMAGCIFLAWATIGQDIAVLKSQMTQINYEQGALKATVDVINGKLTDLAYQQGRQEQKLEDERQHDRSR